MEWKHVAGQTWYLEGQESIPVYIKEDHSCILIDSGWCTEREEIELALQEKSLTLAGILGTHVHTDHTGNHRYFQQKYQIPVALSYGESQLSGNALSLKAYVPVFTPREMETMEVLREIQVVPDVVIPPDATQVELAGVTFEVVRTPGHSPDHIALITPDQVLCLGDALLAEDLIRRAKLPYFFAIQTALDSMKKLQQFPLKGIVAHQGVVENVAELAAINHQCLLEKTEVIGSLISERVTYDELLHQVCENLKLLTNNLFKAKLYARDLLSIVDYLVDQGRLQQVAERGMVYYLPVK